MNSFHDKNQQQGKQVITQDEALLTNDQMARYSRQILLPELGIEGQKKLLKAKVAIVGAGGLGAPTSIYLAAAGVGTIGLIDADVVDQSNLHRQILHFDQDVGKRKTSSGKQHLNMVNPDVHIIEHHVRLDSHNALEIFSQYDVIVNGSDNFPTRYLVNDACVLLKKPLVDASILKWEGNLHVFTPEKGCYRCLFPEPPQPGTVPSCSEAGIIGALAGVMGTMEAMETIKVLLGLEHIMDDKSFYMDLKTGKTRTIKRSRRTDCPVCGDTPTITELIDYHQFCGLPHVQQEPAIEQDILSELNIAQVRKLQEKQRVVFLDVRKEQEYKLSHIPESIHVELDDLPKRVRELSRDWTIVCVCDIGVISTTAVAILQEAGHHKVYSLIGGLLEWENRGLPLNKPQYHKAEG